MIADVIIIGAGLAGATSAITLAKQGYSVALVDAHMEYPSEFRAEKAGEAQMALFQRLGIADIAHANVMAYKKVRIARFGRVFSDSDETEFGFHYADLVNGFRRALPGNVRLIVGRVADIATSDDRQSVTMNDGTIVTGRLLVIATGLGDAIKAKVGIERITQSRAHSTSLGFSLVAPASEFDFESLVYYGQGPRDRISYITIFRTKTGMRANLFTYCDPSDAWIKAFRAAPEAMMLEWMPGLKAMCGRLTVKDRVAVRPIDLSAVANYHHDGVVLLGDAFSTCCPIIGMGLMKVLTDVERLCLHHLPRWMETPGMGLAKIGNFYKDEVKIACDTRAHALSVYARSVAVDPGLIWAARRVRNTAVRRGFYMVKQARQVLLGRPVEAIEAL